MDHCSDPARGEPEPAGLDVVLDGLEIALQPLVDLATGVTAGYEALARFGHAPHASVDAVIAASHDAGFGDAVEAACVRRALDRRSELPLGTSLAVNLSPDFVDHPSVQEVWDDDLQGVVVEVTEHASNRSDALFDELTRLRARGARIAVDDVGTGYAGLLRLATLRPDIVKIDRTIVTGISRSWEQRTVLEALVTFAERMGALTIAEGIETLDDLGALSDLDVDIGQGYAIGRPSRRLTDVDPLVAAACRRTRAESLQKRQQRHSVGADATDVHAITLALSGASGIAELRLAIRSAADELGVDSIGVSVLGADRMLREIAATGEPDPVPYALADFPTTRHVVDVGDTAEVHVSDPGGDPGEQRVMVSAGLASLLIVPLRLEGRAVGVLELGRREHRRWTSQDVAHARGLSDHVGQALVRTSLRHLEPERRRPRPLSRLR